MLFRPKLVLAASALAPIMVLVTPVAALAHNPSRTVSIKTAVSLPIAPDTAIITLSVQHAAPTAIGARQMMAATIDQLRAALQARGHSEITVTTSNLRTHSNVRQERVYRPNGEYSTKDIETHTLNATHTLTITGGDMAAVEARNLLIADVNQVNAIKYQATPTDDALKAARKEALDQAMQEASEIAANLDMGLGLPTRINLSAGNNGRPISSQTPTLLTLPATANVVFSLEAGDQRVNEGR